MLEQAFVRPIPAEPAPSSVLFDAQQSIRGAAPGLSPDITQHPIPYRVGSAYPVAINLSL